LEHVQVKEAQGPGIPGGNSTEPVDAWNGLHCES
jgi:hypothetical protein